MDEREGKDVLVDSGDDLLYLEKMVEILIHLKKKSFTFSLTWGSSMLNAGQWFPSGEFTAAILSH